jgi:hypothetical protein
MFRCSNATRSVQCLSDFVSDVDSVCQDCNAVNSLVYYLCLAFGILFLVKPLPRSISSVDSYLEPWRLALVAWKHFFATYTFPIYVHNTYVCFATYIFPMYVHNTYVCLSCFIFSYSLLFSMTSSHLQKLRSQKILPRQWASCTNLDYFQSHVNMPGFAMHNLN